MIIKSLFLSLLTLFLASCTQNTSQIAFYPIPPPVKSTPLYPENTESDLSVTVETFTPVTAQMTEKYGNLDGTDPGHYKYIISLHNINPSKSYTLLSKREAIGIHEFQTTARFSGQDALDKAESVSLEHPVLSLSSRGFLPGEKVDFTIQSDDNTERTTFSLALNPILKKSPSDNATVEASLLRTSPLLTYQIKLENFRLGEKIKFTSISGNERVSDEITFNNIAIFNHMPEVINENGGTNQVTLIRKNGEQFTLQLPWGEELKQTIRGLRRAPN